MSDSPHKPPYHRPNLKWECGRACGECPCRTGPTAAGNCTQLTDPCQPQSSLRVRRGKFVLACVTLTLGGLLFAASGNRWIEFFAPGPLTSPHAQILNRTTKTNRCADCHGAGSGSALDWVKDMLTCGKHCQTPQTELCLKCHQKQFPAEVALLPHNRPLAELAQRTDRQQLLKLSSSETVDLLTLVGHRGTPKQQLACADCHKEHHGAKFDLKAMTDRQCQACHQNAFHSFADGHPEFRLDTHAPRRSIAFDHATHAGKHFGQTQRTFDCALCHAADPSGKVQTMVKYKQACGACHDAGLKSSSSEGLIVFALPTIPLQPLAAAGHKLGAWPAAANGDFDGKLPPILVLLLSADDQVTAALKSLAPDFDLSRLDAAQPDQLAAGGQIALAIKRLFSEFDQHGNEALVQRLEKISGRPLQADERAKLTATLPMSFLVQVARHWFSEQQPPAGSPMNSVRSAEPLKSGVQAAFVRFTKSPELLIENPLKQRRSPPAASVKPVEPPAPSPPPTVTQPEVTQPDQTPPHTATEPDPPTIESPLQPEKRQAPPLTPNRWTSDETTFTLRYQPTGHADPWLVAWLAFVGESLRNSPPSPQHPSHAQFALQTLKQNVTFATCIRCHVVERQDQSPQLSWTALTRDPQRREFTRFSHKPHLLQPSLQDCSHCHQFPATAAARSSTDRPHQDFLPITKQSCVHCHNANSTSQSCTLCHLYHVPGL